MDKIFTWGPKNMRKVATVSKVANHLVLITCSISWESGLIGKSDHLPCINHLRYSSDGVHQESSQMIFLIVSLIYCNGKLMAAESVSLKQFKWTTFAWEPHQCLCNGGILLCAGWKFKWRRFALCSQESNPTHPYRHRGHVNSFYCTGSTTQRCTGGVPDWVIGGQPCHCNLPLSSKCACIGM
jgi:hypothetical protein